MFGGAGAGLIGINTSINVGTIKLNSGNSNIQTVSGNNAGASVLALPTVSLIATDLVRNTGATANFLGTLSALNGTANLDTNNNRITILGATAASLGLIGNNGGILPFATANTGATAGGDFASYNFLSGSITPFSGYVNSLNSAGPNDVVKLNVTEILTSNRTIAALVLYGNALLSPSAYTLTLGSGLATGLGAILSANSNNSIVGGSVNVGALEGIILSGTGSTTTINSNVTGGSATGGLTISGTTSGAGTVNLPSPNTYSGDTYVASGLVNGGLNNVTLGVGNAGSLSSGTLYFNAGTIQALTGVTIPNDFQFNTSSVTIGNTNNSLVFAGNGTIGNTLAGLPTSPINTFFTTLTIKRALTIISSLLGGTLSGRAVVYRWQRALMLATRTRVQPS